MKKRNNPSGYKLSDTVQRAMKELDKLKTLEDYRLLARDPLFDRSLFSKRKNAPPYYCVENALNCSRLLIQISRSDIAAQKNSWKLFGYWTQYQIRNSALFDCIKLMEFALAHKGQRIHELFPNWPAYRGSNIKVFTSPGNSYLEAAFGFVCELGSIIIGRLRETYQKHTKRSKNYFNPFTFINNTPAVDDLRINPEPDIIIKEWFDRILKGVRGKYPENRFPDLQEEYKAIGFHLKDELNLWEKEKKGIDTEPRSKPLWPKQWADIFGVSRSTIRRWEKDQVKRFKKDTPRKWSLPFSEVPARYLPTYQQTSPPNKS
ncbi:hypothetical protein ACFL5Z_09985 [Planctomycetota bacterium]